MIIFMQSQHVNELQALHTWQDVDINVTKLLPLMIYPVLF